jgi:hypothetical protein
MQNEVGDLEITGDDDEIAEDDDVELDEEEDAEDTVVFSTSKGSDNVGDVSVEINVEELIAEFESSVDSEAARRKEIRRRLEEIREQKEVMKELEDTYSSDLNDDD